MLIPAAHTVLTPIFPLLVSFTNAQQNTYTGNLTRTGLLRPKITPAPHLPLFDLLGYCSIFFLTAPSMPGSGWERLVMFFRIGTGQTAFRVDTSKESLTWRLKAKRNHTLKRGKGRSYEGGSCSPVWGDFWGNGDSVFLPGIWYWLLAGRKRQLRTI